MRHRRRSGTRFLTFHEWAAQGRPPQLGALAHPTDDVGVRRPGLGLSGGSNVADAAPDRLPLRALLLLSAAFLAVQVVLTDYGDGHVGAAGLWFVVGCLPLLVVYRRCSRVACGVAVVTAFVGAVIYALATLQNPLRCSWH
jgi:hypothetical protein